MYTAFTLRALYTKTPYMDIFTKSLHHILYPFLIAYMNYSYNLLVVCVFTCEWGLIVPKCLNVVVFNLLYMVSKIWMSRETIFGHKEAIILHVRHGMYETKCISSPIVTDSLHKNPEVGTVVPENAVLNLGAFLLNK